MPITCITCGRIMPDNSEFCPSCGRAVQIAHSSTASPTPQGRPSVPDSPAANSTASRSPASSTEAIEATPPPPDPPRPPVAFQDRICAAAAYLTFLPAAVFLFLKPYARRPFVRFHAMQSVFFWVLVTVVVGIGILASSFGFLLLWLFTGTLVALALFLAWLVLSIKALLGEWFHLPWIGDVAEQLGQG
jgi:uncharacterized membrane protein